MLYFVFTIDGDWDEYFNSQFPDEKRKPDRKQLVSLIKHEILLASKLLKGKFLHFVHSSPLVREFFLQPEFICLWKEIERNGGSVGVHCHEEDIYRAWYFNDAKRMARAVGFLSESLRMSGLTVSAYRGGFMAFGPKVIPALEQNNLFLDFSCDPGRHLFHNDVLVSDWRGAPSNFYRMSHRDHRKPGSSKVFEVPLAVYIEKESLFKIWKKARGLRKKNGIQMLSVLAHTYDYTSWFMRLKIKLALLILRKYGKFINVKEALAIIGKGG